MDGTVPSVWEFVGSADLGAIFDNNSFSACAILFSLSFSSFEDLAGTLKLDSPGSRPALWEFLVGRLDFSGAKILV